jgi:hypothetical protein
VKRAVSISLGSAERDKRVEITLLGKRVLMERIGTDGDVERATALYNELDGKVDALGVGGIDLSVGTDRREYPIRAACRMVQGVKQTPVVDGRGLKYTLERECIQHIEEKIGADLYPKRAMVNVGVDRYGMAQGLVEAGYEAIFGDLQFSLGLPIPLKGLRTLALFLVILAPIASRLPIRMLYPTGEKQHETLPRFTYWYRWATIIAGDCSYTKRYMPPTLPGKTILTNSTTPTDVARFQKAGVRYLITTTPRFNGRSFGTNMLEAALVAVVGEGRRLTRTELNDLIGMLDLRPQIQQLND